MQCKNLLCFINVTQEDRSKTAAPPLFAARNLKNQKPATSKKYLVLRQQLQKNMTVLAGKSSSQRGAAAISKIIYALFRTFPGLSSLHGKNVLLLTSPSVLPQFFRLPPSNIYQSQKQ
jgi:hypothetical protein